MKIANNAESLREIRKLIGEVATQKPNELALIKKLRSIERRLESQQPTVPPKRIGRILSPIRQSNPTTTATRNSGYSKQAQRIVGSIPKMKAPDVVQVWINCLAEAKNGTNPNRKADAIIIRDWIRRDWERRLHEQDYFVWPRTEADPGRGSLDTDNWLDEGMLKYLGYTVGRTNGAPKSLRQLILTELFEGPVLPAFPSYYLAKWGQPGTPSRLKQLAETLAAFTRNAKRRRNAVMNDAIRDWEFDLKFLYDSFYVGRFGFAWPVTT